MKVASLIGSRCIEVREVPRPVPAAGEVLIKIRKVGLCGTDVHLFRGERPAQYPLVLGHEGLGVVTALGSGAPESLLGQRVVIEPNVPCGSCRHCRQGRGNICSHRRSIGVNESGCFAEYVCIPHRFVWPLAEHVSDEQAIVVEPAAIAVHALKVSGKHPGTAIAVLGLGAVGILLVQLAARLGYRVFAADINADKCERARQLGAVAMNAGVADEMAATWSSANVEAVFECAGAQRTASIAISIAPRGATVVLVGLCEAAASFSPLRLVREGISIVPSMIYDHPEDFARTLRLLEAGVLGTQSLVTGHYRLQDIDAALAAATTGEHIKLVVDVVD